MASTADISSPLPVAAPVAPRGRVSPIAWLIGPALLLFVIFFVLPFGAMALLSFLSGNPVNSANVAFTTRHYERLMGDSLYLEALIATMRIGLVTTIVSLLIGYPLAHWMARMHSRFGHALLLMAVIAPMLTGIVVRTFAWMTLLQDSGVINTTLIAMGWIEQPIKLMYNEFGTVVALVHIYVPFMVLTLQSVIEGIDRSVEEAAFSLGAAPATMFWRVLWPLALPGIIAGTILTFILGMNAYATPVLLGGPEFKMMGPLVFGVFQLNNWPFGAAVSFILMTTTLVLTASANILMQRRYRR